MRLRCGCRAPLSGGDLALKSRPLRGLRRARGVFRIAYVRSRRHARNGRTRFLHRVYPACISPRTAYTPVFGIALRRSRVVAARGGAGGSAPLPRYPAQPPDAPTRYFPVLHGPRSPRRTLAAPGAGRGFNGITRASRGRRSSDRNLCCGAFGGRPPSVRVRAARHVTINRTPVCRKSGSSTVRRRWYPWDSV